VQLLKYGEKERERIEQNVKCKAWTATCKKKNIFYPAQETRKKAKKQFDNIIVLLVETKPNGNWVHL